MTTPDPQTAADAAGRVQAWLDEWSLKVQGNLVVTGCGCAESDGCTELTAPDIDALLAIARGSAQMASELEQVRAAQFASEAWLGGRIEALRKVLRDERDTTRAARAEADGLRRELDEATEIITDIGEALNTTELYIALGDLAQLFAPRTTALADRMEAADLALVQARAATDNGKRTPLADVLVELGMAEDEIEETGNPPLAFCASCGKHVCIADNGNASPHVGVTGWCKGEDFPVEQVSTLVHNCENCDGIAPESCLFNPAREA